MQGENNVGLRRLINAMRWSMKGFRSTYKNEEAFRQEVLLLIILAPLGLWLGDNGVEKALLVGPLLIVLIVELLNSAIESVVDRISTENHKLSGRAKDQGSAAVLVSLMLVGLCWIMVLFF
ncbi:MAG: diacylglycerol kinase [Candidatus Thiodiazotropha lotti]|uniref:Diacylglycerol kinase n=1 Tax=Candidatus Thiodiazotropha endoloripes TaxID=1818881 RepID=A0A1E2UVH8_9GAMM|nr:diacylglycerol kinase [Candidatus Thiodiazotropha endoloripes]MCG7899826.1 diacylglycerol kinase [Candidatus Thiodiazotropha weberae]MCG7993773.1 diacylglycerol kinase [Candidatus Thiodiazotropha lotti]MCG7904574.1 diacylglycerol kinase [Candidatus Thiodiazotropha weberae]MCG7915414.1 diacylglycerol kinase [Candidatus Thiodiazotropha weberae]MCG8001678.1 diacylglycerol kinase [Candidatus Thiodiazotropha lotti]